MRIAITDANIFIDLIHIDLHTELFAAELEIHTTLLVVDELNDHQQGILAQFITDKKLTIHIAAEEWPPESIQSNKKLSPSDKSVFSLAVHLNAFILTGDSLLRKISGFQMIEVHGILWLFDRFVAMNLVPKPKAIKQLEILMRYNKRLPSEDCMKRISAWSESH